MTIESIWRGKTNEKLSQRMVLNMVIKEKRPHVWRDRVVAAISRDAYAAVTNNPYRLPGLSRQRTTSHSHSRPPPAGCRSVRDQSRNRSFYLVMGRREKEVWKHATGLMASARIASHFTGQSKSDGRARGPWGRQDDPPAGIGLLGRGPDIVE